jgi:SHS2 domain-containing protein
MMDISTATSFPPDSDEHAGGAGGVRRHRVEDAILATAAELLAATIENPGDVEPRTEVTIELEEPSLNLLLRAFSSEFLFLRDAYGWLLRPVQIEVEPSAEGLRLRARLEGECLDPERHHRVFERRARLVSRRNRSRESAEEPGQQTDRNESPSGRRRYAE